MLMFLFICVFVVFFLLLPVYMDTDTKVLNCLGAGYTTYLLHLVLREDLGLLLV